MIEILFANVMFWTVWFGISHIPLLITQYAIDNYDRLIDVKKKLFKL